MVLSSIFASASIALENLVVMLGPMAVTTKFVVPTVTMKWVEAAAYFLESCKLRTVGEKWQASHQACNAICSVAICMKLVSEFLLSS